MINPPRKFIPPLGPPRLSAKQRALAQWRGTDLSALEKANRTPGHTLSSLVPKILKGIRMDRRQAEAEIVRVWNNLLDPSITAHAQPTGIYKGTLFVAVDSSVWLDEIVRYRRKEILDRLQHSFGRELIKRISFKAG